MNSAALPTAAQRATPTAEKTITHVSSAEYIATGIKRHKVAAAIVALFLVVATASAFYLYRRNSQPLTSRDTVLLTDFVNTTGEPVFDGTLKQALAVHLGQTPFLNLYPEERVRETLRFMGRSPDDRITRDVGREICQRQGIKAMLTGTIASLGSHYVITLEAIESALRGSDCTREYRSREQGEGAFFTRHRRVEPATEIGRVVEFDTEVRREHRAGHYVFAGSAEGLCNG